MPRGSLSHSDAPYEASRLARLQGPAVAAVNVLVAATLFLPYRTARVRWRRSLEEVTRAARGSGRPIIYYSWHAYEPFLLLAFRDVPRDLVPRAIGHDGFKSRLLQRAVAAYGLPVWVYRRRSPISPTIQIIRMLAREAPIVSLVADAGGAPRIVRPGFVEVARSAEAWLVPIQVRARPRLRVRRPWRYGFPLPFSQVDVYPGDPIDGRTATGAACQEAMKAAVRV